MSFVLQFPEACYHKGMPESELAHLTMQKVPSVFAVLLACAWGHFSGEVFILELFSHLSVLEPCFLEFPSSLGAYHHCQAIATHENKL